ncbi:hypothetical protein DTO027B5_8551 [Paecilomyces variotii]|nr:hypothetical protein DTO021C3_7487 [Paecilomyces variotii]KAJ9305602.1 hypothetical protein DTO217A2_4831 [Paecilomyces variotii]KAJ9323191.1 hypothetical protein DTO027B3_5762 [Paecilomyces variotii]KAJ9328908.1 hypothetical protein DTO027B5_8551 [Paecilomyces variotii]KAJ9361106.1 hypothetical protein DTO027B9_955 [Paecilomyces variotii]
MADDAELESFRRQWREEVSHRTRQQTKQQPQDQTAPSLERFPPTRHEASDRKEDDLLEEDSRSHSYGEFVRKVEKLSLGRADEDGFQSLPQKEPSSALEHFEKAVEKEAEGSLGDSLSHYRKAYRLDSSVDKTYRKKHFGHAWKPTQPAASQAPVVPESSSVTQEDGNPLPTPELIASFANLKIPQAEPLIENTPPPPCPISEVPSEVIVEILRHVALMDPALLPRLALVCKRLAYHVAHEQHIWKRLCQGPEFGFESMHYSFACDVAGNPVHTLGTRYTPFPRDRPVEIPKPLSTWSQVFQTFPRIRFTGVYISTVNYTRPGAASAYSTVSWNTPIHIVTYYRYLRFYRDGTVISLLSTTEPVDVVPHISKENVISARAAASHQRHQRHISDSGNTLSGDAATNPVPPTAMATLKYALRGRWHLTPPTQTASEDIDTGEPSRSKPSAHSHKAGQTTGIGHDPRDLVIETEGVDPKYTYMMHLSLRSPTASRPGGPNQAPSNVSKNTKLIWKGFWSYNKLTDDWAEFGLRNDRAFVFRRVRGWGLDNK